jgi:tRNA A-37 threonylcarbamoyl transferase component Bud32
MNATAARGAVNKIGDYLLLEKIGNGSMATVYKGRHTQGGQYVAIKVMSQRVAADKNLSMRFARECKVARALEHPHIVRVLDYGLDGSRAYLVMEYVAGENVGQILARRGRLDVAEAVRLIAQVGQALDYAHRQRLVHRDIKPANILISRDGQAKLNDLGLVKDADSDAHLTCAADILGTPNFMAPEQFENAQNADARSDLYSLAATLYMAITGEVPFSTGKMQRLASLMHKKLTNDIPQPGRLVAGLSARVNAAIMRALRADPKERQASVLEFVEALQEDPGRDEPGPSASPAAPAAPAAAATAERRRAKRFPSRRRASCRPFERASAETWPGEIVDVSATGLCLQLERRFEPGTVLAMLLGPASSHRCHALLRVVWAKKHSKKSWRLGGHFDQPLCEFEVDELRERPLVSIQDCGESPDLVTSCSEKPRAPRR